MDVRYRTKTELRENDQSVVYEVPVDSEVRLLSHGNSLDLSDGDDDGALTLVGYEAVGFKITKKENPPLVHVSVHCQQHSPAKLNIDQIIHDSLENEEKHSSKDIRQRKRKILFIFVNAVL